MSNYFYGAYHWEFEPVEDRVALLKALQVFCDPQTNLFIEALSPSLLQRIRFWRMRSYDRTDLHPDALYPPATIFHIILSDSNLQVLTKMVRRDGLNEKSIAHIKGYSGDRGLFWFHGFCDKADQTLACSRHVDDATIAQLESLLGVKAQKIFGELKTDRQRREDIERLVSAMQKYSASIDPENEEDTLKVT